uniref:Mlh1_C domain-containing protein n=1 Tax=Meloidogyne hapla TaxID=6305 RepID=A0A1I8BXV3_MELHA
MGAYDLIKSENPIKYLSVYELLQLQLKKDEMEKIENFCQILIKNRNMLWDYFSIKILLNSINEEKEISECSPVLAAIPCLINGYLPEMEGLSLLLYQLANVNYDDEKLCYAEIAFALADFHLPSMDEENDEEENLNKEEQQNVFKKQNSRIERSFRSLIFPALRNRFLPNSELGENIKELTSTAKAFKHFGRC